MFSQLHCTQWQQQLTQFIALDYRDQPFWSLLDCNMAHQQKILISSSGVRHLYRICRQAASPR